MMTIPSTETTESASPVPPEPPGVLSTWAKATKSWITPSIVIGGLIVAATAIVAVFAPFIAPYKPLESDLSAVNVPPMLFGGSSDHILGTDPVGRDLLSRIIYGLRTSLFVSIAAVAIAVVIGAVIGLTAGYFGRLVDIVLMRLTDIQLGFPFIILAVVVLSVARSTLLTIILVLSLATWPIYARVIRSIMLGEKEADYVVAGRAVGVSHSRIIFRYVGRPILRPLSGIVAFDIANVIIFEAILGFLAIGLQPPTISLGNILADGKSYLFSGIWWTVTFPGLAILIVLLGINLLADGIQQRQARHA